MRCVCCMYVYVYALDVLLCARVCVYVLHVRICVCVVCACLCVGGVVCASVCIACEAGVCARGEPREARYGGGEGGGNGGRGGGWAGGGVSCRRGQKECNANQSRTPARRMGVLERDGTLHKKSARPTAQALALIPLPSLTHLSPHVLYNALPRT